MDDSCEKRGKEGKINGYREENGKAEEGGRRGKWQRRGREALRKRSEKKLQKDLKVQGNDVKIIEKKDKIGNSKKAKT